MISRVEIEFSPTVEEFYALRTGKPVTVLSGPNNGGKTLLLKHLFSLVGHGGYMVGCNRFSHVDVLNSRQRDEHEHRRYYENFMYTFETSHQNTEDNELKLDQILTGLKDQQRAKLFSTAEALIGNKFVMQRTDTDNEFSPYHVLMDGENLRYGSSGTRLFLTILGILLDERFSTLLLDEPEIGLSPRIQTRLARFLYDAAGRAEFCPHLNHLFIATHSHIFLDRSTYSNNFVVQKQGNSVTVVPIGSVSDMHQLQFNMLGNELESLFLPSAIAIVEGDSDVTYLHKRLALHLPGPRIPLVPAHGEGEVRSKLNFFKQAFGDVVSSLYRGRLFVVFDKEISTRVGKIGTQGVPTDNTILLSRNGIESYYPQALVAAAFHCDVADVGKIDLESDPIDCNGHRYSKKELAAYIAEHLLQGHPVDPEIQSFIEKLRAVCQ